MTKAEEIRVLRWALGRIVGHNKLDAYLEELKPYAARSMPDVPKSYLNPQPKPRPRPRIVRAEEVA